MNKGALVALLGGAVLLLTGGTAYVLRKSKCGTQPTPPSDAIGALAYAISVAEGSPADWNNPGDLTASFGFPNAGPQNRDGVLKFTTCDDGWKALYAQLSLIASGGSRYGVDTTLADFGKAYSGTDTWAVAVASALGVEANATLGDVLGVNG